MIRKSAVKRCCQLIVIVFALIEVGCGGSSSNKSDQTGDGTTTENRAGDVDSVQNTQAPSGTAASEQTSRIKQTEQTNSTSNSQWLSPVGEVPAFSQREGDPEKGRHALLHESYVSCGLPERVFRQLQNASVENQPAVNTIKRHSSAEGLPYFTNRVTGVTGEPIVSSNCLSCHGTVLFGELIIGLGNEFADFTGNPSAAVERAGALIQSEQERIEWERFADRIAAIAPYTQLETVGVNSANNLTAALISHRDVDTHAWLATPQMPSPPTAAPPVSVPPWWRMAKKHAMFNLGEGRGDHARLMLAASMLCADSETDLDTIDAYAPDIRAFLANIEPPAYPFDINKSLANEGKAIFIKQCASCHGRYEEPESYPNLIIAVDEVGTDSRLMDLATSDFGKRYAAWFNTSWFGDLSAIAPSKGYYAPPLDGLWATAPFLHNGSVPTLTQLLSPNLRPTVWRHISRDASDPESYDSQNIGWRHERLSPGSEAGIDTRVYDTTRLGYGNAGHRYGSDLSEPDRGALLEYLKTL